MQKFIGLGSMFPGYFTAVLNKEVFLCLSYMNITKRQKAKKKKIKNEFSENEWRRAMAETSF